MRLSLVLPVLMLAACGGSDPHPPAPQCVSNATCTADQVCFDGACVDSLAVAYRVELSIQVAPTEPDGTAWDNDGSPPDVEAQLDFADPTPQLSFDSVESFHATWTPRLVGFKTGQTLSLHVDDADTFGGSDFICNVSLPELRSFLHAGGASVDGTSCQVNVAATPMDPGSP